MSRRRTEILQGILRCPEQIINLVNPENNENLNVLINEFFQNIWHNYLKESTSNTVMWMIKFNNDLLFNTLLEHLSKAGWIISEVSNTYAFIQLNEHQLLQWVTKEELNNVKFKYKLTKYRLGKSKSVLCDTVQTNNKYINTGLIRQGFMKAGNYVFKYDTECLIKYLPQIAANAKKGLEPSTKEITYQEIISELLNYYSIKDLEFTLGNCYIDSRGRAIFNCLKKIFNPLGNKDARALLVCKPEKLTSDGFKCVYAAIAELVGYRGKNYKDKYDYGMWLYMTKYLPSLNEMIASNDYSNLHVLITLERIYENLNNHDKVGWYIPLSLDSTASIIQFVGVLTNDHEYMKKTNLIESSNGFEDIWTVDYCSREHIKKVITPICYGSSKQPNELWDKAKLIYTQQQLNKINHDLTTGTYANANSFKDFIISNVQPKAKMEVKVWNDQFIIECNKFNWRLTDYKQYFIYVSKQNMLTKVIREFNQVPDLEQFKLFYPTLLIHGCDSQVANAITQEVDCISNHDSWISHPNNAVKIRKIYLEQMWNMYINRKEILRNYFSSIGITQTYEDVCKEQILESSLLSPYCLK